MDIFFGAKIQIRWISVVNLIYEIMSVYLVCLIIIIQGSLQLYDISLKVLHLYGYFTTQVAGISPRNAVKSNQENTYFVSAVTLKVIVSSTNYN